MPSGPHRSRFATFIAILAASVTFRLRRYEIAESSMRPTLHDGDWALSTTRHRPLRPGDVVVLTHPDRPDMELVKRIASIGDEGVVVLGDDPLAGSVDSVSFGPVSPESVSARVLLRYRPLPPRLIR